MSPLLRHPGIVPSLFSGGIEHDNRPSEPARLGDRLVTVLHHWVSLLAQDRSDTSAGRSGSVLAGSGIAFLICGKPLFHSALLLIGAAPKG